MIVCVCGPPVVSRARINCGQKWDTSADLCRIGISNYSLICKSGNSRRSAIYCREDDDIIVIANQLIERNCEFLDVGPSEECQILELPVVLVADIGVVRDHNRSLANDMCRSGYAEC